MEKKEDKLVWSGYLLLLGYNSIALSGVFENPLNQNFYKFYIENFGTLCLMEFVVVAALFVNMILNYDKFKSGINKVHLIITGLSFVCLLVKVIFFFMGVFKVM